MNKNKSILEQLAGLGVALENISEEPKMVIKIMPVGYAPIWKIKNKTAKPFYRMNERW